MKRRLKFLFTFSALGFALLSNSQNTFAQVQPTQEKKNTAAAPANGATDKAIVIKEQTDADNLKGSLKAVETGKIGKVNLVINYHSPAVRKRIIWNGLVAFGQVWVTGAHSATTLETNGTLKIGGKAIPAGKYALFTIPGEKEWVVILNKNWEQHLADEYAQKDDIIRVTVKPQKTDKLQERLRYVVKSTGANKGTLEIQWEKLRIPVPITL
ncbi:DUF2911 domain-containing protein [Adhaeribacter aquaticus]|uniref:DUF2911 domain-containing protein n=1 Tax=Adhaeribacter aquaticus TaxID=299567 RepID=UPI000555E76D|nr:DUF2911 domain-containing protein [Adhaeribacter aquaticus]